MTQASTRPRRYPGRVVAVVLGVSVVSAAIVFSIIHHVNTREPAAAPPASSAAP